MRACLPVQGRRLIGEMGGGKWWGEARRIRDGGGRGERAGWMKTETRQRCETEIEREKERGRRKWGRGGKS